MHTNPRPPTSMAPVHLPANTDKAHPNNREFCHVHVDIFSKAKKYDGAIYMYAYSPSDGRIHLMT
jgi:hypothetical protein